jgi:type VI secretion system secreted protein Hcp
MAAVDYLLEIEGIKGESTDAKFPGTIEIESFSWVASNPASPVIGAGGRGAGRVSFQDLQFTAVVNKASPALMLACAKGTHIPTAALHVRKQGGTQVEYYTISLEYLLVSSYQSGSPGSGRSIPTDQFSLNFKTIEFSYSPQKPDGTLGAPIVADWDMQVNSGRLG